MLIPLYVLEGRAPKVVFVFKTDQEGHSWLRLLIRGRTSWRGGGVWGLKEEVFQSKMTFHKTLNLGGQEDPVNRDPD